LQQYYDERIRRVIERNKEIVKASPGTPDHVVIENTKMISELLSNTHAVSVPKMWEISGIISNKKFVSRAARQAFVLHMARGDYYKALLENLVSKSIFNAKTDLLIF
jgi:hypothetical protein